jgi:hypothetical protein
MKAREIREVMLQIYVATYGSWLSEICESSSGCGLGALTGNLGSWLYEVSTL